MAVQERSEMTSNLLKLFRKCVNAKYTHVENAGDYAIERKRGVLYIYFEKSSGITDWKNNFDFPAKPYKRMGKTVWFAHRGFLRVWKSIEPYVADHIKDESIKKIIIVGYSHGAAMAVLCHEYAWYHRPDLRDSIFGYGFGCPRVLWGVYPKEIRQRWNSFLVIRNIDDIVTHVPPAFFGFKHVGAMLEIGSPDKYSDIIAHTKESIINELKIFEREWENTNDTATV